MNKKGFMLFETLVVSTFILGTLIFLYVQFSSIERQYDKSFRYNTVIGLYNAKTLSTYLENDGYALYDYELSKDSNNGYLQINNCQQSRGILCNKIIKNINAKNVLFVGNNISILQSNLSTSNYDKTIFNEEFKQFILTLDTVEKEGRSRIIIEYNDNTFASVAVGISKANENKVDFQIRHNLMNTDGETYTVKDTDNISWFNGYKYETKPNTYSGFVTPEKQIVIASDGLIVDYYYVRNQYSVSIEKGSNIDNISGEGNYYHGTSVTLQAISEVGYHVSSWSGDFNTNTFTMPIKNVSMKVDSSPDTNTKYMVRHYQMDVTGSSYTLVETENLTGTTDTLVSPNVRTYQGFTSPSKKSATIKGDGTTVIDYYYTRNKYLVTVGMTTGIESVSGAGYYYYGASVTAGYTLTTGYHFTGWTGNNTTSPFTMPASNVTMQANAAINTYTIKYASNGGTGSMSNTTCTYNANCTLSSNSFTKSGYSFNGWSGSNGVSYANGATVKNLTSINGDTITMTANWKANKVTLTGLTGGCSDQYGLCYYINNYGKKGQTFSYNGYSNCKFNSYSCGMNCDDMGYSWYGWGQFIWNDGGWWDVYSQASCSGTITCDAK